MENSLNSQLPTMFSSTDLAPSWVDLPRDITARILLKLGAIEILTVAQNVCKTWRSVCGDPSMWRSIDMDNAECDFYDPYELDKMCRRAVDLSQGQLADITLYPLCKDDLLIYISERCPRLQRLQLVCFNDLEDGSLSTALQNLPLLEELHLYYTSIYPGDDGLMIGISCPLLKSFKLNYSFMTDLGLKQISRMMPKLRHLELIGCNDISNKGLQAILDGCPHLETLDLRECYNLDFSGDIEKACSQRLEVLRRPDEEVDDFPFPGHRYRRRRSCSYEFSLMDDDLMFERDDELELFMSYYYEDYLEFYEDSYDLDDDEIYDKHRCERRPSTRHALKREAKKRPQKRSSWTRRGCTGNWKSNSWYL